MASDIKVVILLKENRGIVGIQSPDCDPIFSTVEGDMVTIAAELPGLVESAQVKFTAAPKNPPSSLPEPAPAPVSTTRTASASPAKAKDAARPSMF
jgi:hypothetical protein